MLKSKEGRKSIIRHLVSSHGVGGPDIGNLSIGELIMVMWLHGHEIDETQSTLATCKGSRKGVAVP